LPNLDSWEVLPAKVLPANKKDYKFAV